MLRIAELWDALGLSEPLVEVFTADVQQHLYLPGTTLYWVNGEGARTEVGAISHLTPSTRGWRVHLTGHAHRTWSAFVPATAEFVTDPAETAHEVQRRLAQQLPALEPPRRRPYEVDLPVLGMGDRIGVHVEDDETMIMVGVVTDANPDRGQITVDWPTGHQQQIDWPTT